MKKVYPIIIIILVLSLFLSACTDADVASHNISKEADQFNILRRIVFYNGITNEYILVVEGYCSIGNTTESEIYIVCKTGPEAFKKHYLGLSDNVTYFAEQLDSVEVSLYHYNVVFKPSIILPNIDVELP